MAQFTTFYYQDGNTVRKEEALTLPTRETYALEQKQEREHKKRVRKHAHKRAMRQNRLYTVYFAVGMIAIGGLFYTYVNLQNDITTKMNHIGSLESEITDLKAMNAAAKSRINSKANLKEVKNVALHDLNMVYAGEDQIVYYSMEDEDYMNTYE